MNDDCLEYIYVCVSIAGRLRFRKPLPVKPWMRELKAMFLPPSCAQPDVIVNRVFNFTQEERSEDCLYLNIWSPLKSSYIINYDLNRIIEID